MVNIFHNYTHLKLGDLLKLILLNLIYLEYRLFLSLQNHMQTFSAAYQNLFYKKKY